MLDFHTLEGVCLSQETNVNEMKGTIHGTYYFTNDDFSRRHD